MSEKIKAIRGSKERTEEIIKWLVEHGAKNATIQVNGTHEEYLYFVNSEGNARCIEIEYECLVDVEELPRWRADSDDIYYFVDSQGIIRSTFDDFDAIDDHRYEFGNYFKTEHDAEEYCYKIKELLLKK